MTPFWERVHDDIFKPWLPFWMASVWLIANTIAGWTGRHEEVDAFWDVGVFFTLELIAKWRKRG